MVPRPMKATRIVALPLDERAVLRACTGSARLRTSVRQYSDRDGRHQRADACRRRSARGLVRRWAYRDRVAVAVGVADGAGADAADAGVDVLVGVAVFAGGGV